MIARIVRRLARRLGDEDNYWVMPQPGPTYSAIVYSVAVGLTIFVMVVTDTEYPPAAGTAFGIAISGYSFDAAIAIVTGVVVMSTAHLFLRPYLKYLP